jgi:hypothetical protein
LKSKDKLIDYNDLIPILLRKLSPEDKGMDELFDSFKINDLVSFWNPDTASGYGPLKRLIADKSIDEHWKLKAADKIHEIISKEEDGKIKPREEWERAISSYCDILDLLAWKINTNEGLPISNSFYEKEISFVLKFKKGPIVSKSDTKAVLNILQNRETWHNLARNQILPNKDEKYEGFTIRDEQDVEFAQRAITDFHGDEDIGPFLSKQLQKYVGQSSFDSERQEKDAKKEEAIFSRMKRVNLD